MCVFQKTLHCTRIGALLLTCLYFLMLECAMTIILHSAVLHDLIFAWLVCCDEVYFDMMHWTHCTAPCTCQVLTRLPSFPLLSLPPFFLPRAPLSFPSLSVPCLSFSLLCPLSLGPWFPFFLSLSVSLPFLPSPPLPIGHLVVFEKYQESSTCTSSLWSYGSFPFSSQRCCTCGWYQTPGQLSCLEWSKHTRQCRPWSWASIESMPYTKLAPRPLWPTTFSGTTFDTGLSTDSSRTNWPFSTLWGPFSTKRLSPTKPRIPPRLWNTCCSSTSCTWYWTWGYGILIPPYSTYVDFTPVSWTSSWPISTTTIWTRNSSFFLPETYSDHTIKSIELWHTLSFWKNTNGQNPKPTSGSTLETRRRTLWYPEA